MTAPIALRRACLRFASTLSNGAAWAVAAELYDVPGLPDEVASLLRELERHTVQFRAAVLLGDHEDRRELRMRTRITATLVAGAATRWCVTRDEVVSGELSEVLP